MNWTVILWLVLVVVFLWAEASTVAMISLWFAAGSLVAMVIALMNGAFWLQFVAFAVISALLLLALRPLVRKYVTPKQTQTNVDAVVGTEGYVTAAIDNLAATGEVKLGAMVWTARSTSGEQIPAGTLVKVDRIEGVKAFVSLVSAEQPATL